jgi:hypothetical protein
VLRRRSVTAAMALPWAVRCANVQRAADADVEDAGGVRLLV